MSKMTVRRVTAEIYWFWAFFTGVFGNAVGELLGLLLIPFWANYLHGWKQASSQAKDALEYLEIKAQIKKNKKKEKSNDGSGEKD